MASELLTAVTLTLCLALGIMGQSLILVQSPEFKPAREGQTVELWCGVENSKVSDIDLKWEYLEVKGPTKTLLFDGFTSDDRFKSTRDVSRNSFNLTITNVKLVDSGFYYCLVHDTNSRGTGTELIVVGSQSPSIVQSPKLVNIREGGTAQLQCTMDKVDVSRTDVHWYRQHLRQRREWILTHRLNDQIIVPTAMVPLQGSTQHLQPSRVTSNKTYILILIDVSVSDAAVYHCCVWSTVCGDGTQLNVTGSQSPSLVQSLKLVNFREGGMAQLQCTVDNGDVSSIDVHWYRQYLSQRREWILTHCVNDQIIVPTATFSLQNSTRRLQPFRVISSNTYILILTKVSVNDTAVYHCCVWSTVCANGTQLNVTKQSLRDVQTPYIAVIVAVCCLALVFLCITVIVYMKQLLCFKKQSRENGSLSGQPCNSLRAPDGNAVYAEVNDQTQSLPQASPHPPISTNNKVGVDEIQYSQIYFKKATRSPSLTATDSATEYAVIQCKK